MDAGAIEKTQGELLKIETAFGVIVDRMQGAKNAQEQFNVGVQQGSAGAERLWSGLKKAASAVGEGKGLEKLVGISDRMVGTKTRLSLLVDDGGSVAQLEQQVMGAAQRSRAAYFDTADAVATLGTSAGAAFGGDMNQVVAFLEQANKQFVIGGATAQEQSAAMSQLTQAMSAGVLQGEDLNAVLAGAPGIGRAIEQYMGIASGSIQQVASQGMVTSDVVKNALFSMADQTNAKVASVPMTWAQVFTQGANVAIQLLQPLLDGINWLANNLEIIGPIALGVGAAFLVFQLAAHWTQIAAAATAIYQAVIGFLSIGFGVLTGNTAAASGAVFAFNSSLLASPIVWVVMLIAVLIGALYAGVAAYNKFTGAGVSATEIIGAAFGVLGGLIANTFLIPLWNSFASIANFVGNVFHDPVAAVKVLFYDMCLTVLGYLKNLAESIENLLNKIPGVTIDITGGLDRLYSKLEEAQQKVKDESGWVEYVQRKEFINLEDAASSGSQGLKDLLSKFQGKIPDQDGLESDYLEKYRLDSGGSDAYGFGNKLDGVYGNTGNTAENTAAMKDSLEMGNEELSLLRDIAEREAVNRFTTAEIKVEMVNNNAISTELDLDGIVSSLETKVTQALLSSAEGVHV